MSDKLKSMMHVDVETLTRALQCSEEEKSVFLIELYHLIESKGMLEQFLEVAKRTLSREAFEGIQEWVKQNTNK